MADLHPFLPSYTGLIGQRSLIWARTRISELQCIVSLPISSLAIPKPKIAVLGWGSLVWKPEGDPSVGQKPLLIKEDFKQGTLELPLEYSRISCDGRLTLVVDSSQKEVRSKIHYAESNFSTLDAVIENLREREGMPTSQNVRVANRGEQHSDDKRRAIGEWLDKLELTAAVWTGLQSNYETKGGRKFTTKGALRYLLSLKGETRDKAFIYILSAPDSVDTRFRRIARWPEAIAVHEAGHYIMGILLGRKMVEIWIEHPDSKQTEIGLSLRGRRLNDAQFAHVAFERFGGSKGTSALSREINSALEAGRVQDSDRLPRSQAYNLFLDGLGRH